MATGQHQDNEKAARKRSAGSPLLIGAAVTLLALPSAVLAFSTRFDGAAAPVALPLPDETFHPATVDPRLSRSITVNFLPATVIVPPVA